MEQIIVNGVVGASIILLIAVGFSLIYGVARFFHLAHGAVFTMGGYVTYLIFSKIQPISLAFIVSFCLTIVLCGAMGVAMEITVYKPLRRVRASALMYLIASLGLLLFIQNIIAIIFGNDIKVIPFTESLSIGYKVGNAVITITQLLVIITSFVLSACLILFMKSDVGLSLRAISDNQLLAESMGIDIDRMMILTFAIGSAFAGIAGGLLGIETTIHPSMGFSAILYGILACIVGGIGSITGTILGAFLIGMVQSAGINFLAPEWKDTLALAVLLIILLIKPSGIIISE